MTTTTYLEWDDQTTGDNNNTWGDVADSNWTIMETAIARFLQVSTTGGSTVLTTAQNRYPIIEITGALVSNATITVRTAEKNWVFINSTTGSFTVAVKTAAGASVTIPRGEAVRLYCDGTDVKLLRYGNLPNATAGGTVDAITATFKPETISGDLRDGYVWLVTASGANTSTTPTFNPDSTGALTITKDGGSALAAGDIPGADYRMLLCYDGSTGGVELLNPFRQATTTQAGLIQTASVAQVVAGASTTRAVTPDALHAMWGRGTDVAGGATLTLGDGGIFNITGTSFTATAVAFTDAGNGRSAILHFDSAGGVLTHSATFKLPGAVDITVEADDYCCVYQDTSGHYVVPWYQRNAQPPAAAVCRAWVRYNGSTNAIVDSFNVSSVTDNGTGDFTVNFTDNMPSANYVAACMAQEDGTHAMIVSISNTTNPTAAALRVLVTGVDKSAGSAGSAPRDPDILYVAVFA